MQPDAIAHDRVGIADNAHGEQADVGDIDIGKAVGAEMFHDIDLAGQDGLGGITRVTGITKRHMFRANAHLGGIFGVAGNIGCVAVAKGKLCARAGAVDHIHFWRADELGDKQVARMAIEIKRGADLFGLAYFMCSPDLRCRFGKGVR